MTKATRPFADARLENVATFFETLTLADVARLSSIYSESARFKDPFNEVQGVVAIQRVFAHMFKQVQNPRFEIISGVAQGHQGWLEWHFLFERSAGKTLRARGASKLEFAADGRVLDHRDYWDTGEELYAHLPVMGWFVKRLRKALSAS